MEFRLREENEKKEGYEKQKQLVGVKRRGRKHHPTLPLHPDRKSVV